MTGFVAAGAQIILFTTGLGNASASRIAPTIKLTARRATVAELPEQIDFDAGDAWDGGESRDAAGRPTGREILAIGPRTADLGGSAWARAWRPSPASAVRSDVYGQPRPYERKVDHDGRSDFWAGHDGRPDGPNVFKAAATA